MFTAEPVEYSVAAGRYLATLRLGPASLRVYRIALATWAWALVDTPPPLGDRRRGAPPPAVPLAVLDAPDAAARLRAAAAARSAQVSPRTLRREISILRGAVAWWRSCGWVGGDPTAGLRTPTAAALPAALGPDRAGTVLKLAAPLREQALWHVIYESGAPVQRVLALCVPELDLERHRSHWSPLLHWGPASSRLLGLLALGRFQGPVFLAHKRAAPGPPADRCAITGRGRLSYRRAAELFTAATRELDPGGNGWTLRDLRRARGGRAVAAPR